MPGRSKRFTRKHGRNQVSCQIYRNAGKHEKSQARQLERHLAAHPTDKHAQAIYDALPLWAKRAPKSEAA